MRITINTDELIMKLESMIEDDINIIQLIVEDEYSDEAIVKAIDVSGREIDFGSIELISDAY